MNIVEDFRTHLFTGRNKASKVTVKNYVSDVRKFILWYENTYEKTFTPQDLSTEIIRDFQNSFLKGTEESSIAARSGKRYLSSLRKFCRFLCDSSVIEINPFDGLIVAPKKVEDPWQTKSFKTFLINSGASKLTTKNYTLDVQQFISWLEKVTEASELDEKRFAYIDFMAIEKYKERLLSDANFSPTSINRKLSSLRRYVRWLQAQGHIQAITEKTIMPKKEEHIVEEVEPIVEQLEIPIPLTALQQLSEKQQEKPKNSYSSFAPIRLAQKMHRLVNQGLGAILFNPIVDSAELIQYALWKRSGKQVFAPIKSFIDVPKEIIQVKKERVVLNRSYNTINNIRSKTASIVDTFFVSPKEVKPYSVRNISKSFYAPLKISLTHLPWYKKLAHHLRHTRPDWYYKYHSWPLSHHIHVGILMFAMAVSGVASYQAATSNPGTDGTAMAAQSMAPPRTLSFTGRLLDRTATPITAETNLRFAIYNSATATGSAMLWQETQNIKPDQNGSFSTILGKKVTIAQQLFQNNPNLYVGIMVGPTNELQPRQQIATAGLASNTQTLQGLKPITKTSATTDVILALDSSGDLTIGGTSSPKFQATGGQFTLSGQTLLLTTNPGSNGDILLQADGSGIVNIQSSLQNTTGKTGLAGVPGAIDIADMLAVITSSASQSALTVKQNSTGDIISGFNNEIAKFRVDTNGNGMFAGNLLLNGNTITTNSTTFGIANTNVINLTIGNNASALSLGGSTGVTTVNNDLDVKGTADINGSLNATGPITANGGLVVPLGKNITFSDFTPGAIPFIGTANQLTQDAASFNWDSLGKSFKVVGAVCVKATAGACAGSTAGTIYASNATVQAADVAENYISSQELEPGDVVIPESLGNNLAIVKSTAAYQPQIIGIISTKPGFTLNSDAQTDSAHPHVYPMALQGRVPVKVSSMNGPIKAGDPLTSSPIPGVAMKATKPGQIIAKALEDFDAGNPNTIGKVMSFVNITYQAPQSTLTDQGNLDLAVKSGIPAVGESVVASHGIIDSIKSKLVEATEISTQTITVAGMPLDEYIASVVNKMNGGNKVDTDGLDGLVEGVTLDGKESAAFVLKEPTATISASTAEPKPTAAIANETTIPTPAITTAPLYNSIATQSALPSGLEELQPTPSISPVASDAASLQSEIEALKSQSLSNFIETIQTPKDLDLEKIDTKDVSISQTLSVTGRTTLSDVGVTGKVTAGLMTIDGLNSGFASINTSSGPLKFQSDGFNGVDFMNGKVAIDPNGNLQVNGNALFAKDVTVKGKLAANIIAPIPGSDLTVENTQGKGVVKVSQNGDISASGSGKFTGINIVRGAQADTSATETKANSTAGKGIIKARQKERTIYTPYVTRQSLIYVTATSDTQKTNLYVARQTAQEDGKGSFTIQIPTGVAKDITFNWWIVN